MPDTTPTQDVAPQELTDDQIQALWNEEAAKRDPGAPPPSAEATTEAEDANESPADDTPAAEKPAAEKPGATAKPEETAPEDPVAKRLEQLENDLKRANGRIAALQSEQAKAAKQAAQTVKDAPSQAQQAAAIKNPEKWAALKADFPEWGEATEELIKANLPTPTAGPSPEEVQQRVQDALVQREMERVERRHKGWLDTIKTDEFRAWKDSQPEEIKALGASDLAEDAIEMLDLFAKSRAKPAAAVRTERANRLAAAATTPRASRAVPTPRDDSELTPDEIWAQEAARREKRRQAERA